MNNQHENQHATIAEALEQLAASQPAAPALHAPGRQVLTYADLDAQIRHVRERLGGLGVVPGDIVAGVIPSRPEMAVACLTLPASSTFAPLGPSLTPDAYAQLIVRMGAKAVLLPRTLDHPLRAAARQHGVAELDVVFDQDAPAGLFTIDLGRAGDSLRRMTPARSELAYVLASSGTTGRQKLIPSTHRQTLLSSRAAIDWLGYAPGDVSCHLLPIHLGNGLRSGLLSPLLGGASVVCLPESDVDAFFAALNEFEPTCLNAGFTLHRAFLHRAPDYRDIVRRCRFRFLRAATGRLDPDEIDRLEQTFGAPVLVALSSAETTWIAHEPLPPRQRKRGSVGLPLGNEVAIVDDSGQFCPAGRTGEIVVRGPLVFPGYLDEPHLTAASFLGEWFRTGDLGAIDDDGYVYLSGRIKEIINRGGDKIAPLEIDAAIEALPGVKEAATFGVSHPTLGEEVVAAVVRDVNATIDEVAVVEHVRRRMGPRKAPRKIYFVERLPRTDNGKVRRFELPRLLGLDQQTPSQSGESRAPSGATFSPLEGALAGIWASVMNVGKVGRDDDFVVLGGDSSRGMQLIAHVKTLFGIDLPIHSLFGEAATIAGMARAIEAIRARGMHR